MATPELRCLMISPTTGRGGSEEYMLAVAGAAVAEGWRVAVALPDAEGSASVLADARSLGTSAIASALAGMPAGKLPAVKAVIADLWRTLGLIRRTRPNVVHLVLPAPERGLGIMLACALAAVPLVTTFQLVQDARRIGRGRRALYRLATTRPHAWICVSDDNRRLLSASMGIPEKSIDRIYNGVAPVAESASTITGEPAGIRTELGIAANAPIVLNVGRLTVQKGQDRALRAMPTMLERRPELVLVIVGEGERHTSLLALANALGVAASVKFTGRREDVARFLAAADVFLFPSLFEGYPFALVEAMAAGLPVATSRRGPMPEVVRDGVTGWSFDVDDPASIAGAVGEILDDPPAAAAIAARGRAFARDELTSERMLMQTLAVLQGAAARGASRARR